MKQTTAGIILLTVWATIMILWGSSTPDIINYERNKVLENPCDFMSSGQYSVNC